MKVLGCNVLTGLIFPVAENQAKNATHDVLGWMSSDEEDSQDWVV